MENNHTNGLLLHIHDDKNGLDYTLHGDYYLNGTSTIWRSPFSSR